MQRLTLPRFENSKTWVGRLDIIFSQNVVVILKWKCMKVLTETEIKRSEKRLDIVQTLENLLPTVHKSLSAVPGRLVLSNCDVPTENVLEYSNHVLKPFMQVKNINEILDRAILVIVDAVSVSQYTSRSWF